MAEKKGNDANRLYGQAQAILRDKYREEFNDILAGLWSAEGLVYKPRLTAEEKAAAKAEAARAKAQAKLDALLSEFPELAAVKSAVVDFPDQA